MLKSIFTLPLISALLLSVQAADDNSTADAQHIGFSGTLSSLDGGLGGVVTVKSLTELDIKGYKLGDASAPALYWWGSTTSSLKAGFRISNTHITTATPSATDIVITLDAGKTSADFTIVGLWCEKFEANFGQATLAKDGASAAVSPSASASPSASPSPTKSSGTAASPSPSKSQASAGKPSHFALFACLSLAAAATFASGML